MAWKTEMSYQNANSTLWTEPLWFSLSVPRWLHFPTKLVSAPHPSPAAPSPPPPSSFPHVFLKAEICFSSAGSRANRLSFPCRRQISSNSVPFTFLLQEFSAQLSSCASAQCGSSQALSPALTWWNPLTKRNGVVCLTVIGQTFRLYLQNRIIRCLLQH